MTFDSEVGLAEKLISAEVTHFGIGSPNENGPLYIVRPKFHRGSYMDQLLYRVCCMYYGLIFYGFLTLFLGKLAKHTGESFCCFCILCLTCCPGIYSQVRIRGKIRTKYNIQVFKRVIGILV